MTIVRDISEILDEVGGFQKTYSYAGTLTVNTGTDRFYAYDTGNCVEINAYVGTAPVGSDLIMNIKKNGSQAQQITITAGQTSSLNTASLSFSKSDFVTVDITQIGSSTAGADLKINFIFTKV